LVFVACLAVSLPAIAGAPGSAGPPAELPITQWISGGVTVVPIPFRTDAAVGGTTAADLLTDQARPPWSVRPAPVIDGTAAQLTTRVPVVEEPTPRRVVATLDGAVKFDVPDSKTATGRVWLLTTLAVDRFTQVELVIESPHPVRPWLWSDEVELDESDERRTATLELAPGEHRLQIETVLDRSLDDEWGLRALLRAKDRDQVALPVTVTVPSSGGFGELRIEDVVGEPRVDAVAVSPDGRLVATAWQAWDSSRDATKRWVTVSDGRIVEGPDGPRNPMFAPRSGALAWTTSSDAGATLWVDGREVVKDWKGFSGAAWLPDDSGWIITASVDLEPTEEGKEPLIRRVRSPLDRQPDTRSPTQLWRVDRATGARLQLTAGADPVTLGDISADGTWLVAIRTVEDLSARPFSRTEAWQLQLATGAAEKILQDGWLSGVRISPDGRRLLVHAGPSAFGGKGSVVAKDAIPNDYDGQLYVWNLEAGEVEAITRELDPAVREGFWNRTDGSIYARVVDGERVSMMRRSPTDATWSRIGSAIDVVDGVAFAAAAPVAVIQGTSPWSPFQVEEVDLETLISTAVVTAVPSPTYVRGEVRPWSAVATDGTEVFGTVYLPPGFSADRRWPMLVYFYGGTSPVDLSFGGRYPKEWWASLGYVVLVVNPAGAVGRGQERSAVHTDDWGEHTARQILDATDAFLADSDFVDPARVGCLGASYGGFMSMRVVTMTDRFAAALAHAGISALTSYWGGGYWGYSYGAVANADEFPWNRRDVFVDRSPLFAADHITTPLLLTHGTADPNVPPVESIQLFTALKLLGREVELLEVSDQEHWIMAHDKRIEWSQSIMAWFDRWLKHDARWWDHMWPAVPAKGK
jgi:dipeptidyl aminopeptidase/acylaminoacyl peptidase